MNKVYLGLGSNLGDKFENICKAIAYFDTNDQFTNVEISSFYETIPYGGIDQANFINGVISFNTNLSVNSIFDITKNLEKDIGRTKTVDWGPREIDIDILLYGEIVLNTEKISIPHKDLLNRDFVIVPLLDLNEQIVHPIYKKKIKTFLSKLNDKYIIGKINFSYSKENLIEIK